MTDKMINALVSHIVISQVLTSFFGLREKMCFFSRNISPLLSIIAAISLGHWVDNSSEKYPSQFL